jgi:hypothetical protein
MARAELSVADALAQAHLIDATLGAWEQTAPQVVASLGGRDALARRCEMTCIGPVPRLDVETWKRATLEWWERRQAEEGSPYAAPKGAHRHRPAPADDVPIVEPATTAPRRSLWRIFSR